jgi:hypothetical protein
MILNKLVFIKKLAFIFRPRVGARLQHLTLWVTINLCLPIKQEFTKIRFPVSELLSKLALQGFSSALSLVSDCAASPENAFGEAPYRGDARNLSQPLDRAWATGKIASDKYTFLGRWPIVDPVFGGQDQTLMMRTSRFSPSLGFGQRF